jgi:hypothetical protein
MPLLALCFYFRGKKHCLVLVLVLTFFLRASHAVVLLFLMICALIALTNEQYFLPTIAIALVHEL